MGEVFSEEAGEIGTYLQNKLVSKVSFDVTDASLTTDMLTFAPSSDGSTSDTGNTRAQLCTPGQ